jgi:hypothetical protein
VGDSNGAVLIPQALDRYRRCPKIQNDSSLTYAQV